MPKLGIAKSEPLGIAKSEPLGIASSESDSSGGGFVGNAIGSFAKNVTEGVTAPLSLAKGVTGMIINAMRGKAQPEVIETLKNAPAAFWNNYADAYGGWDNIKSTLYNDPFRVVSDLSAVLTGGGMAGVKAAGTAGRVGRIAAKAIKAGDKINPMGWALGATGKVGEGMQYVGERAAGAAYAPPRSVLHNMAESKGMTDWQLKRKLGRDSLDYNIPPTGPGLDKALGMAREGVRERMGMEQAAQTAGRTVDYGEVAKNTAHQLLGAVPDGGVIPRIRATLTPNPTIASTKTTMQEMFQQHPDLTVPFETWRTTSKPTGKVLAETVDRTTQRGPDLMRSVEFGVDDRLMPTVTPGDVSLQGVSFPTKSGGSALEGVSFNTSNRTPNVRVPNPEVPPPLAGQAFRTESSALAGSYGKDAAEKAAIIARKSAHGNLGKEIDAATSGIEGVTMGPGKRDWGTSAAETHDLMNMAEAIEAKYSTAANPVRLYEAIGAMTGNLPAIGLGMASRPNIKWRFGHGMDKAGSLTSGLNTDELARALLLARMQQAAAEPER